LNIEDKPHQKYHHPCPACLGLGRAPFLCRRLLQRVEWQARRDPISIAVKIVRLKCVSDILKDI
jgi:hypothetical protein